MQFQEAALLALMVLATLARLRLAEAGNKTENGNLVLLAIGLCAVTGLGALYLMFWQFYVLLLEIIGNAVLLGFAVLEGVYGLAIFFSFKNY
jgi:hypothetical protein